MTARAATIPGLLPWLGACAGPQSLLDPAGPAARTTAALWWGMFGFFSLVLVAVVALWLYALYRRPRAYTEEAARRVAWRWLVGGGLALPGLTIVVLLVFGIPAGQRMLPLPTAGVAPLKVEVIGHQWWWEVRYPEAGVTTANQLLLPAGRAVDVHVRSADVIHAFWVPRLAGKIDMIPGIENVLRIEADAPGQFRAQCAEFCGAQHARMVLAVEALTAADFAAWLAARQRAPAPPAPAHVAAAQTFGEYCGRCHRVAEVSDGHFGPDLSDVGARAALGAGTLPNQPGALREWLHHHQQLKPGNAMPVHATAVTSERLDAIAAWLATLVPPGSAPGARADASAPAQLPTAPAAGEAR